MAPKDTAFNLLRVVVAQMLLQAGFESSHQQAVQSLTEYAVIYLKAVLQHCGKNLCELTSRTEMNLYDVAVGAMELGVDCAELTQFLRSWLQKIHLPYEDNIPASSVEYRTKLLEKWLESNGFNNLDPASLTVSAEDLSCMVPNRRSLSNPSIVLPSQMIGVTGSDQPLSTKFTPVTQNAIKDSELYPPEPILCAQLTSSQQQEFLQNLFPLKRKRHIDTNDGTTTSSLAIKRVIPYIESQKSAQLEQSANIRLLPDLYVDLSARREAIQADQTVFSITKMSTEEVKLLAASIKPQTMKKPGTNDLAGALVSLASKTAVARTLPLFENFRQFLWEAVLQKLQSIGSSEASLTVLKPASLTLGPAASDKIAPAQERASEIEPAISAPLVDVVHQQKSLPSPKLAESHILKNKPRAPVIIKMNLGNKHLSFNGRGVTPLSGNLNEDGPASAGPLLNNAIVMSPVDASPLEGEVITAPKVKKLRLSFAKKANSGATDGSSS